MNRQPVCRRGIPSCFFAGRIDFYSRVLYNIYSENVIFRPNLSKGGRGIDFYKRKDFLQ